MQKINLSTIFTKTTLDYHSLLFPYALVLNFCEETIDEDNMIMKMLCGKFGNIVVEFSNRPELLCAIHMGVMLWTRGNNSRWS